ncbi:MAG TPA: A/G-specific adenine glycosylase [Bryobacteraceae bacterium]|nr:A/G-specific adenine glycosylase [Bryobacteraceae bacterium]
MAAKLLRWYGAGHRDLPWRQTRDPYRIWVSEIMLQQTRAEAVIPYYSRFLERFPDAATLARASEQSVLACWSGLGYYSRARNLHRAARVVADGFPSDYESIRALPGVGDYTAAAIASIAFDLPHAVLDGNVMRVIARVTNDAADIGATVTRTRFREIAQQWLDGRRAGAFNQALMELGATVCLPRAPRCAICPLAAECEAHQRGTPGTLPVKLRKMTPVKIAATVVVVSRHGRVLLWQRPAQERRLASFWELPSAEQLPDTQEQRVAGTFRHTITHHHYEVTVLVGRVAHAAKPLVWVPVTSLTSLPLSTTARKALRLAGMAGTISSGE